MNHPEPNNNESNHSEPGKLAHTWGSPMCGPQVWASLPGSLWFALFLLLVPLLAAQPQADDRIPVASASELPVTTYTLSLPLAEFLASDRAVLSFAELLSDDLEDLFARYRITDPALRKELYQSAMHAAMLAENWPRAKSYLEWSRGLEERQDLQRVSGLYWQAWIELHMEPNPPTAPAAMQTSFRAHAHSLLEAQPWQLVHREVELRASRLSLLGQGLLDQAMQSLLSDPTAPTQSLNSSTARDLVPLISGVRILLPLRDEALGAYRDYLSAHMQADVDIWSDRTVALEPGAPCHPVLLAVWDTGVDVSVFPDQLWTNPGEVLDGLDNDGNGFIDDLHGIGFGPQLLPTPELLYPTDPDESAWKQAREYNEGLSDATASIDSKAARKLQRKLSRMDADEVRVFMNLLGHYAHHVHGTHVAGIALNGNPFARLLVARVGLDHHEPGPQLSLAWAHRFAAMCLDTVAYLQSQGVRVVNMSWGWGVSEIEQNLRNTGYPGTDTERHARALAILAILQEGLEGALTGAPEILFVCGAGNTGMDSSRDGDLPTILNLPNLIAVGGADRSGAMAAFTSFGPTVHLYADGFQVESFLPGGERAALSGTSMAAPQVANLAAKLLALHPELTPSQLIDRMLQTASPTEFAGQTVYLMNAKAACGEFR
ncbi:MAG TPA: S8 family serine peptidase [Planctomycetota bacterium]|nr:S8 family serine peptidase [Planctomycetota bacterium]